MKLFARFFLIACSCTALAQETAWVPVSGADYLRELVGGATVEFEYRPGEMATGTYNEDGTASIKVLNGTFRRTWDIKDDDQVCYSSDIERQTVCFRFEQNAADAEEFRAVQVDGRRVYVFRVLDAETKTLVRETAAQGGAEGSLSAPSSAELAAELSNPNTALGTMNFFLDYSTSQGSIPGADDASTSKLTFQPGMPYPLSDSTNFFVRPLFPVFIKTDAPTVNGFETKRFELGDISYDVAVFNSAPGGLIYGGGIAGTIPTATDDDLGLDQWLLGPEAIVAVMRPWGVLGLIASHQWDVAGDNKADTSITGGQYFYAFNIKDGWIFGANPVFTYNHEATSGNKLTFPLGIGVSKTAVVAGRPWKLGLQYWYYVDSPDNFGPEHMLRLQVSPVIKLPW